MFCFHILKNFMLLESAQICIKMRHKKANISYAFRTILFGTGQVSYEYFGPSFSPKPQSGTALTLEMLER